MEKTECRNCEAVLRIPEGQPSNDWIEVVCSHCGGINHISLIRLRSKQRGESP